MFVERLGALVEVHHVVLQTTEGEHLLVVLPAVDGHRVAELLGLLHVTLVHRRFTLGLDFSVSI